MDHDQVRSFQHVDLETFKTLYTRAYASQLELRNEGFEDRWPAAARAMCELLTFVLDERPLWSGLHEAVDGLNASRVIIPDVQGLALFLRDEAELLTRHGLDSGVAAEIIVAIERGLKSFSDPTHSAIDETRTALQVLAEKMCAGVTDWVGVYGAPEREAQKAQLKANAAVGLSAAGGLVGTVVNGVTTVIAPPLFALSIGGGVVATIGAMLGFKPRRGKKLFGIFGGRR